MPRIVGAGGFAEYHSCSNLADRTHPWCPFSCFLPDTAAGGNLTHLPGKTQSVDYHKPNTIQDNIKVIRKVEKLTTEGDLKWISSKYPSNAAPKVISGQKGSMIQND